METTLLPLISACWEWRGQSLLVVAGGLEEVEAGVCSPWCLQVYWWHTAGSGVGLGSGRWHGPGCGYEWLVC
jgi:hypothetical protein